MPHEKSKMTLVEYQERQERALGCKLGAEKPKEHETEQMVLLGRGILIFWQPSTRSTNQLHTLNLHLTTVHLSRSSAVPIQALH